MTTLYKIELNGEIIYIGITNDLKRRQQQHNLNIKKNVNRPLYTHLNSLNISNVTLTTLASFKSRVEAKRMECYLILQDYFNDKQLKQKVPRISDR